MAAVGIMSLAPELLSAIFAHLHRRDLSGLLRVNKHVHDVAHRLLWETLYLSGSAWDPGFWATGQDYLDNPLDARACSLLAASAVAMVGLRSTRRLILSAKALRDDGGASGVLEMLRGMLERGEARLRTVEIVNMTALDEILNGNGTRLTWLYPDIAVDSAFLKYLKAYGDSGLSSPFSIELRRAFASSLPAFCAALHKSLSLPLLATLDLEFRLPMARRMPGAILALTELLNAARNLERLRLEPIAGSCPSGCQVWELGESLAQLQATVDGLGRLRSLEIKGTLFHPSFFLAPPTGVASVRYRGEVSIAWWRQFAKCPFAGVQEMQLLVQHVGLSDWEHMSGWAGPSDEEMSMDLGDTSSRRRKPRRRRFWLRDVAVTSLRVFRAEHDDDAEVAPADLEECVMRRNRELARGCVNELQTQVIRDDVAVLLKVEELASLSTGGEQRHWWPVGLMAR
ncbi:hypothetical protein Dda_6632 [Drechslerella dactyloides]|uniref:F-box domain-containing protein n=1 Tax=Drechslerella dactyloides TaxID=74499 RepID=A0AAD6IXS7_DREDA|nr:hypothetical protein Dda_6632 [Drechslerella dactyloides]